MRRRSYVERPIAMSMAVLTVIVLGVIAYQSMPLELIPAGIDFGNDLTVRVPVVDANPEEVVEQVTKPIEEQARTISGVTQISSTSSENSSSVRIEYAPTADGDVVYTEIRDRMERLLPTFPEGTDDYQIERFNSSNIPIIFIAVSFSDAVGDPDALLENVVAPRIEAVDGVAKCETFGLLSKRVEIELDPELVDAQGIDVRNLIDRLRGENALAATGVVREGDRRYLMRVASKFTTLEEVENFPVDRSTKLGDIATIGYNYAVANFIVRVDGELCKLLQVYKESEANTLETSRGIARALDEDLRKDPRLEEFSFLPFRDEGKIIEDAVGQLEASCLWGGLLAIGVLYFFLRRVRSTLVVAAAIPLSMVIAIIALAARGGTLNLLAISGLTIGIGMLIDNAIVVSESILRFRSLGLSSREAAKQGVREIGLAVTLATLTTVAVFVPIWLLPSSSGAIGVLLEELGRPVYLSVLASLLVALAVIPVAIAQLKSGMTSAGADRSWDRISRPYGHALAFALRHRFLAGFVALVALWLTFGVASKGLGESGRATSRTPFVQIDVDCPPFHSLRDTDEVMEELRASIDTLRDDLGIDSIVTFFRSTQGTVQIILQPDRADFPSVIFEKLEAVLPEIAGVDIQLGSADDEETEARIGVAVVGKDPRVLRTLVLDLAERLENVPGVLDVITRSDAPNDQITVDVMRERAQRYGITPTSVSQLVAWSLRGAPLSDFEIDGREVPFWISYEGSEVESLGELTRVPVFTEEGRPIPLANVASFGVERGLPRIRRRDGVVREGFAVLVERDESRRGLNAVVRGIAAREFEAMDPPEGYGIDFGSRQDDAAELIRQTMFAALFALVLIFVLMGVLFESVVLPVCVLTSIPFMFVGSQWMLYVFGGALDQFAYVGYVILLGIVVNNAIVLVDTIRRFQAHSETRNAAILEAGEARLRPIMLTALTTMAGLSPLVVRPYDGQGIDFRSMGLVIFGGVGASTIFTLFVVPVAYSSIDDIMRRVRRLWRGAAIDGEL